MPVNVTYMRKAVVGGEPKHQGQVEALDIDEAAPLAARQLVSISSSSQDVDLSRQVAALIPPEKRLPVSLVLTLAGQNPMPKVQGMQLLVIAHYADGSTKNVSSSATFTSSNPAFKITNAVATPDTATFQTQSTTITATVGGIASNSGTLAVKLNVFNMSMDPMSVSVAEGQTTQLAAKWYASDNADHPATGIVWSSSDTTKATVDQNGLVTAVAEGTATITATDAANTKTATCAVTVTA